MKIGVIMFPTDKAIQPMELAIACEERGIESLWFPEHSHIPSSRVTPWGGNRLWGLCRKNTGVPTINLSPDRVCGGNQETQARYGYYAGLAARPDLVGQRSRQPRYDFRWPR